MHHSRASRVQNILTLPDTLLHPFFARLCTHPCLAPFRRKASFYETSAYIHSFGTNGPSATDWDNLFTMCANLQAEQVAVLIAFVAAPRSAKGWKCAVNLCLFGTANVPGLLDTICERFDQWLVQPRRISDIVQKTVAAVLEAGWNPDAIRVAGEVARVAHEVAVLVVRVVVSWVVERGSVGGFGSPHQLVQVFELARRGAFTLLAESVFGILTV